MILLKPWLAISLVLGALWALAGWLLGGRRVDPSATYEAVEEETA